MELADKYNHVYSILVSVCGANESDRGPFFSEMLGSDPSREWRFQGHLGFGGKYWPLQNRVSSYPEDYTREREVIMQEANELLENLR